MFIFCIALLPLSLAFFFICTKNGKNKPNVILLISGLLAGIVVFALKEFLTLSHIVVPFSFSENFLRLLLKETLLPMLIPYLIFFFLTKDDMEYKIQGFFPLTAAYFTIFLPYFCITSPESKTVFEAFLKPVLYTSVISSVAMGLSLIYKGFTVPGCKTLSAAGIAACLVSVFLPALAETMFLLDYPLVSYVLTLVISLIIAAGTAFITIKKAK